MSKSNTDLVTVIKDDHKIIKELYKEGLKKKSSLEDKKEIFEKLSVVVTAHSKSEEAVMYAPTCREELTKKNAFESFEEHGLVELLIEEMLTEKNNNRWEAKFSVVCELLKHHIKEEEEEFLPKIKELYSLEERKEMAEEYREMYSQLIKTQNKILDPGMEQFRTH